MEDDRVRTPPGRVVMADQNGVRHGAVAASVSGSISTCASESARGAGIDWKVVVPEEFGDAKWKPGTGEILAVKVVAEEEE